MNSRKGRDAKSLMPGGIGLAHLPGRKCIDLRHDAAPRKEEEAARRGSTEGEEAHSYKPQKAEAIRGESENETCLACE